jgi:hypothetical protein
MAVQTAIPPVIKKAIMMRLPNSTSVEASDSWPKDKEQKVNQEKLLIVRKKIKRDNLIF